MPKFDESLESVYAGDRATWRTWLAKNHAIAPGIWLIYYKVNSGQPSVRYSEAVKEALCFGWIDSKVQTLDDQRYRQIFTPRKPKSVWSKLNKQYIIELIEQDLMTEAGLAIIEQAKINGAWTSLDEIEALIVPLDLEQALAAQPVAQQNFAAFSKSTRKNILSWIGSAKRPETRQKRIQQTVISATQNQNPLVR